MALGGGCPTKTRTARSALAGCVAAATAALLAAVVAGPATVGHVVDGLVAPTFSGPYGTRALRAPTRTGHVVAPARLDLRRTPVAMSTTIPRPKVAQPKRAPAVPAGKPKDKGGGGGKHQLLLFDDPVNTREYVSKVLCTKVGLAESEAYDVMMMAHNNGMAVVGIYVLEQAEAYCEQMKNSGLVAAVKPVGDDGQGGGGGGGGGDGGGGGGGGE